MKIEKPLRKDGDGNNAAKQNEPHQRPSLLHVVDHPKLIDELSSGCKDQGDWGNSSLNQISNLKPQISRFHRLGKESKSPCGFGHLQNSCNLWIITGPGWALLTGCFPGPGKSGVFSFLNL